MTKYYKYFNKYTDSYISVKVIFKKDTIIYKLYKGSHYDSTINVTNKKYNQDILHKKLIQMNTTEIVKFILVVENE
jgi:hypothetical protein